MSDNVLIALITGLPSIIGAITGYLAAKRSGQAKTHSSAAERNSSAAAQNAATAVQNTQPISNGFAGHVREELSEIRQMLVEHIGNHEIHGR